MRIAEYLERMGRWISVTPVLAIALALALLAASLMLAVNNEHIRKAEKVHQTEVQAAILASSVAAPLAFDDGKTAQDYLGALHADPYIETAGAYDVDGRLVAGYRRGDQPLPLQNAVGAPAFEGPDLVVRVAVSQGSTRLGSVYLRTETESWLRRSLRYIGIALVLVMASLLVAVLGASYASVSEANARLEHEIKGRKEAEEQLRQAQKMEAMGQLTGGVAHDFNNLLMVASSGLDLMERTTDPAKRQRLKEGIRQAVDRGAKLTQQLLTFARRSPLHPEVIDLAARIRGMQDLLDRSLREDVVVVVDAAADAWPVEVDPSQLEVAVLNIALNARDAMPNGGTITIAIANEPAAAPDQPDMVGLSISDSGTGVPPDMIEKLFEPFFTTKGAGHGTGLGLSQVYGFARSSGGEARIASEEGKGTTVTLRIPRSRHEIAREEKHQEYVTSAQDGRHTVLLVEDDDNVAELVAQMLAELGYDAIRTASAAEALERLEADAAFDLVLSDMVMPGDMNGLDLAHVIARRWPQMPVILMTGYSAAAAEVAAEGIRLLVKPYRLDALAAELQEALRLAA